MKNTNIKNGSRFDAKPRFFSMRAQSGQNFIRCCFYRSKSSAGFTLIELLVVIAIIGLLSSVVLASLNSARSKARDAKRLSEIKQLQIALELYHDQTGSYPISTSCGASSPGTTWCNSVQSLSGGHWIRDNGTANVLSPFMSAEPIDPKQGGSPNWTPLNGGTYYYFSQGGGCPGQWYMIVFGLENPTPALEATDGVSSCGGSKYHYGNNFDGVLTIGVSG